MRQIDLAEALAEVSFMELLDAVEVLAQRVDADVRKGRHSILATLAVANPNLVGCEVDVLHPQLEAGCLFS